MYKWYGFQKWQFKDTTVNLVGPAFNIKICISIVWVLAIRWKECQPIFKCHCLFLFWIPAPLCATDLNWVNITYGALVGSLVCVRVCVRALTLQVMIMCILALCTPSRRRWCLQLTSSESKWCLNIYDFFSLHIINLYLSGALCTKYFNLFLYFKSGKVLVWIDLSAGWCLFCHRTLYCNSETGVALLKLSD